MRKLTMDEVKSRVNKINPNIMILSTEYQSSRHKVHCKCKTCNYEWYATPDKLFAKRGCPECAKNRLAKMHRNDLNDLKRQLETINPTVEIVEKEYKSSRTPMRCKCRECGHEWRSTWYNLKAGKGCMVCSLKRRSGANHHKYNPNLTDEERIKNRYELAGDRIAKWRKQVFERDNYTCQVCGAKHKTLNAHHLNSWHAHKDERFDISNGITLCEEHHKEFHKMFGYRNNTRLQFEEYLNTFTKGA